MHEGLDHDDKYRMVEDEFLSVAQRFTVHFHAAEYKRLQKEAKTRNADTISSISRPVTGKMPDSTKRKFEALARVKLQKAALNSLQGKQEDSDSDGSDGLPYVGTTLHGLMDSPRKKTSSISKPGTIATTTRASAGFKHSVGTSNSRQRSNLSPQPKHLAGNPFKTEPEHTTESSDDDDDDLDAPIPAPKLNRTERKATISSKPQVIKSEAISPPSRLPAPAANTGPLTRPEQSSSSSLLKEFTGKKVSSSGSSRPQLSRRHKIKLKEEDEKDKKASRRHRVKQEEVPEAKPSINVIPFF